MHREALHSFENSVFRKPMVWQLAPGPTSLGLFSGMRTSSQVNVVLST